MRRPAAALALLIALSACTEQPPPPPRPQTSTSSAPGSTTPPPGHVLLRATVVATNLDTVWAIAFDPDGHLHFTERAGKVTELDPEALSAGPGGARGGFLGMDLAGVVESGEAGLMGLAIDQRGRRFVMYTAERENRIVRLDAEGKQTVLVDGIAAGAVHDGGRLKFGPDGMLYATTGDAGNRENARRDGLNGRVLRIDPDSGEHEVFTTGHRNPQGLCFTADGKLFSTEHGPDRGDEINILEEGRDYGWPETTGTGLVNYTPTIAPSGCAIYEADLIPQWKGDLLFGTLKDQSLRVLDLDDEQASVGRQERLYKGEFGRIRDVVVGPDGAVYLATSNLDGRGEPRDGDDRIVRIEPEDLPDDGTGAPDL